MKILYLNDTRLHFFGALWSHFIENSAHLYGQNRGIREIICGSISLLKRAGEDDTMSLWNLSERCTKREEIFFTIRYNDTIIMKGAGA